jgi:hypothetical protein
MSLSMYDASIPVFIRLFGNLSTILDKASRYAETKKIDPAVLVNARLAPDMFPLSRQIQIASDVAKGCAARLAGKEVPAFADDETSIADLQARIAKTIQFFKSIPATEINNSEQREITLKMGGQNKILEGQTYLLNFVLPNFYFHITTAYAILRHNGLDVGKSDYLGMN